MYLSGFFVVILKGGTHKIGKNIGKIRIFYGGFMVNLMVVLWWICGGFMVILW